MRSFGMTTIALLAVISAAPAWTTDRCDVAEVFEYKDDVPDVQVLTPDGDVVEMSEVAEAVLVPVTLKKGLHEVEVTRTSRDVYVAKKEGLVIRTRYCHRRVRSGKAIVKYESSHSWTKGTISFD